MLAVHENPTLNALSETVKDSNKASVSKCSDSRSSSCSKSDASSVSNYAGGLGDISMKTIMKHIAEYKGGRLKSKVAEISKVIEDEGLEPDHLADMSHDNFKDFTDMLSGILKTG